MKITAGNYIMMDLESLGLLSEENAQRKEEIFIIVAARASI
jgi:hypothetical protein